MNKKDEIDLRHKFEANCRHSGLNTKLKGRGAEYEDPTVELMWKEVRARGELDHENG